VRIGQRRLAGRLVTELRVHGVRDGEVCKADGASPAGGAYGCMVTRLGANNESPVRCPPAASGSRGHHGVAARRHLRDQRVHPAGQL
jgi:hypothetical protein